MMIKWRNTLIISSVIILIIYVYVNYIFFGDDVNTISPTPEQVERCRNEMYLNKNISIEPLGFKYIGSGIDDAVWFKFRTDGNIVDLFSSEVVDFKLFSDKYSMTSHSEIEWWNVESKILFGGQISLPNNKIMNVGIDKKNENVSIVYIMWHGM